MPEKLKKPKQACRHRDKAAASNHLVLKFTNKEKTRNYEKWHCSICNKNFIF